MAMNDVLLVVVGGSCYHIFNLLKLFISQPAVIKLRIHTEDNILHNCTMSDFQVSSQLINNNYFLITNLAMHSSISHSSSSGPHVQRRSVDASDDTWRIEMKCAFPGSTVTRCCSCLRSTV